MKIIIVILALASYDILKLIIKQWLRPFASRIRVVKYEGETLFVFYNKENTIGKVLLTIKTHQP